MSKIQDTHLLDWRIKSNETFKNEFRGAEFGMLDFYNEQTDIAGGIITSELKARALGSTGNTIKIPVLKHNSSASVGTSRSCEVPNNEVDSALVSLSWQSVTDGFAMIPNRYMNNEFGYAEHFAANMRDMVLRIANKIDQLCVANAGSNKAKGTAYAETLGYSVTGDMIHALWQDRFDFMGDASSIMRANRYYGRINTIGNAGALSIANKLGEFGKYNELDKSWQMGDKTFRMSHNITNGNGKAATMYFIPDGQVGILSRVSRAEYNHSSANEHSWGTTTLPLLGNLQFGTHFYTVAGDMSTLSGEADMICDYAEYYGFAIDIAFVNAYNSNDANNPSPIISADVASGVNGVQVVAPAAGSIWPSA